MAAKRKPQTEPGSAPAAAASQAPAPARDNLELLDDIPVTLSIELGRTRITLDQVLDFGEQSLIELDRTVGDPVDVLVNGKLFARGEVVTVSENFGVRLTAIVDQV